MSALNIKLCPLQSAKCALKCHSVDETVCALRCLQGSTSVGTREEAGEQGAVRDTRGAGDGANWEIHDQHKISTFSNLHKFLRDLRSLKEISKISQYKFI